MATIQHCVDELVGSNRILELQMTAGVADVSVVKQSLCASICAQTNTLTQHVSSTAAAQLLQAIHNTTFDATQKTQLINVVNAKLMQR
eukprot:4797109-Pyramimonas_sp.AAC.1